MKNRRYFEIFLVFVLSVFYANCAKKYTGSPTPTIDLRIDQRRIEGRGIEHYFFKDGLLRINEVPSSRVGAIPRKPKKYLKKLSEKELGDLYKVIVDQKIFELNDEYVIYLMGGYVEWNILLTMGGRTKKIHVFNEKVPGIDSLFEKINTLIPKKDLKIPRVYQPDR